MCAGGGRAARACRRGSQRRRSGAGCTTKVSRGAHATRRKTGKVGAGRVRREVALVAQPTRESKDEVAARTVANEHELALSVCDVVLLDDVSVHRRGVLYHCGKRRML